MQVHIRFEVSESFPFLKSPPQPFHPNGQVPHQIIQNLCKSTFETNSNESFLFLKVLQSPPRPFHPNGQIPHQIIQNLCKSTFERNSTNLFHSFFPFLPVLQSPPQPFHPNGQVPHQIIQNLCKSTFETNSNESFLFHPVLQAPPQPFHPNGQVPSLRKPKKLDFRLKPNGLRLRCGRHRPGLRAFFPRPRSGG